MKIARFMYKQQELWGVLVDKSIRVLKTAPFAGIEFSQQVIDFKQVKLLAPTVPQKIVLVGLNYKNHAKELGMKIPKQPIIFLKPVTALTGHLDNIKYPLGVKQLDYEAELALVIGKKAHNIPESKALTYVLGYTCLNDITARDIQKKDGQWTRAKSFDTFCPVGPWLETRIKTDDLMISAYLNGKLKQHSSTSHLIFSIPYLISFISQIMTLLPGDIISTGTPPGIGRMKPGDRIEVSVEGIGTLQNQVTR
ncbi:MAG: fumarylacetoacetate hydrolase family protein [Candidatus Omnitrophica bacterium]|nr:fumarylacetoacetate hydrolase family protein [Candidatus Omnitrophota bacterium]